MKYLKLRTLGFLFVLLMVFGCLPVGVDAATTVSQVGVNGIAVPAAGERAREYHTSELTVSGADHRLISMACCWHDENDIWIDDIVYTFEKGRSYSITVNFEAVGDCQFADADKMSFKFGSAAKNSYTAEVVYLSDDRKVISVKYSFSIEGKRTYDDIERSTFWNINWPMMDGGPSVSYVHLYDNAEVKAFYWTTDGITKQTGRFHGNTLYYLRIEMKADSGYEFSDEWRAYYYRSPMDGEITFSSDYTEATIVVPYFVTNQRTISKVAVGSMILPEGGEYADVVEDDFLSVPVNVRYKLGGFSSFWYDAQGNKLNDTDVFVNGRKYSVTVYFQADDGYGFADPKYIDASFVDLDPSLYTVEVKDTSDKKFLVVSYTFRAQADPPFTLENHIELTGVDLPVAGRDLGTEVSVPFGSAYHVKESDTGQIVQWWKMVDGVETHESGEYYGENTVYTVKIWVEANGKNFDDDHLTATIDGKTAEVAIAHAKSAMITYTFPATGEDYYHISYDIAFDGNGGSGWMDKVTGITDEYTLPDCEFIAPVGYKFGGWNVDGGIWKEKATIEVTEDLTVKAEWIPLDHPENMAGHIVFFNNDGKVDQLPYRVLDSFVLPESFYEPVADYIFSYWRIGNVEYHPGDVVHITEDTVIFAVFEFTGLTYMVEYFSYESSQFAKVEYEAGTRELPECFFKAPEGKEFSHWLIGDKIYYPGDSYELTSNMQIVAVWKNMEGSAFTDVAADMYYYDAVAWAVTKGITTGTSDTTFSPDAPCTRGQAVTFLWRAAGKPEPKNSTMPFDDVSANMYYYKAVLWAVEQGITAGTSATTFEPDATCTRAQIVTFLWRSNGKPAAAAFNPFVDVAADMYYYDAVLWAVKMGITTGTSATTFSPDNECTRAQIVTFLYRNSVV